MLAVSVGIPVVPVLVHAESVNRSELGGSLIYSYRNLSGNQANSSQGHLTSLNLSGSSYLLRPWLSNFSAGVNFSYDQSNVETVDRENSLVTGLFNLNIFPRSRFPFHFRYVNTDSRLQSEFRTPDGAVFPVDDQYQMERFYVQQEFIAGNTFRFSLQGDETEAESDTGGLYKRKIRGANMSLRVANNNLRITASEQTTDRVGDGNAEDNRILHLDHQYSPGSTFVVTSLASDVEVDRATTFSGTGFQTLDRQAQAFTNFYWRPLARSYMVNGGIRVARFQQEDQRTGVTFADASSVSMSLSGVYQYSIRTSLNMSLSLFGNEAEQKVQRKGSNQRFGANYRSDTYGIGAFIYNWFGGTQLSNNYVDNTEAPTLQPGEPDKSNTQALTASLGQTLTRHWSFSAGRLSFYLNESFSESADFNSDIATPENNIKDFEDVQGMNHSLSLRWQALKPGISHLTQFSISDIRDFEAHDTYVNLVNFQWSRSQVLSRASSLNANITVQSYRQVVLGGKPNTVTTVSGVLNYQHNRLFRVPRLNFVSRLNIARPDHDFANQGVETWWDNQLNYDIGKLRSSLTLRETVRDEEYYQSIFVRLIRRF